MFISLKIDSVLANKADPNEIPHYAEFHLGVHCLTKYLFNGYSGPQRVKGCFLLFNKA